MANFNLSGLLGGMFPMMQLEGLDDEELRLMEELRASGAYVPQVREQNPFAYGAGGRRAEDLAAARQAMQPAMQGRMQDVVQARGEQERNRMAMEAFNRQQQIAEQLRQKRIQDEARRQQLMGMQQEIADQSSADYPMVRDRGRRERGRELCCNHVRAPGPREACGWRLGRDK